MAAALARGVEAGPFLPRPRRTSDSDAASARRHRRGCHDAARSRQRPQVSGGSKKHTGRRSRGGHPVSRFPCRRMR
eukprot:2760648-Prymnesium_polylepis.1